MASVASKATADDVGVAEGDAATSLEAPEETDCDCADWQPTSTAAPISAAKTKRNLTAVSPQGHRNAASPVIA